jgi:hypothetical protein
MHVLRPAFFLNHSGSSCHRGTQSSRTSRSSSRGNRTPWPDTIRAPTAKTSWPLLEYQTFSIQSAAVALSPTPRITRSFCSSPRTKHEHTCDQGADCDVISDEHGIASIAQKFNVGTATPMGGISPQRQKNTLWQCLALCSSGA